MKIDTINDIDFQDQHVLVRVDFNVPIDSTLTITDDIRIREALPTIEYILNKRGSVILLSHLGKPNGKRDPKYSLSPIAKHLAKLLNRPVTMAPDVIGPEVEKLANALKAGEILLLENLRFYDAEEHPEKDPTFAKNLSKLGTFYVNDAFGTAHRRHSSTVEIVQYFNDRKAIGFLMAKEVSILSKIFTSPDRPFYALIGGAKISSKIGVLHAILEKADALFIGGAMAFTFLKVNGISVGKSLVDEEHLDTAKKILAKAKEKEIPIYLPIDVVIKEKETILTDKSFPSNAIGMDIGKETSDRWAKLLQKAKTVFWNGPMGVFEVPPFEQGTLAIAKAIASLDATTVIGGGDSAAAAEALGFADRFTHISTGGGASLEFIERGSLDALEAIKK